MPMPITYPTVPSRVNQHMSGSGPSSSRPSSPFVVTNGTEIKSPPQASLSPSITRRNSGYLDQSDQMSYPFPHQSTAGATMSSAGGSMTQTISSSSYANGSVGVTRPIEYPQVIRMPPAVASPQMNSRMIGSRPSSSSLSQQQQQQQQPSSISQVQQQISGSSPLPPKLPRLSDYPVSFWGDVQIATCGLKNMGNTCYMNAPIQCLSATVPFSAFFREGRWKNAVNYTNPMGSKSKEFVESFAFLLRDMWATDMPYLSPNLFRVSCRMVSSFVGGLCGADCFLDSDLWSNRTGCLMGRTSMIRKSF